MDRQVYRRTAATTPCPQRSGEGERSGASEQDVAWLAWPHMAAQKQEPACSNKPGLAWPPEAGFPKPETIENGNSVTLETLLRYRRASLLVSYGNGPSSAGALNAKIRRVASGFCILADGKK